MFIWYNLFLFSTSLCLPFNYSYTPYLQDICFHFSFYSLFLFTFLFFTLSFTTFWLPSPLNIFFLLTILTIHFGPYLHFYFLIWEKQCNAMFTHVYTMILITLCSQNSRPWFLGASYSTQTLEAEFLNVNNHLNTPVNP